MESETNCDIKELKQLYLFRNKQTIGVLMMKIMWPKVKYMGSITPISFLFWCTIRSLNSEKQSAVITPELKNGYP